MTVCGPKVESEQWCLGPAPLWAQILSHRADLGAGEEALCSFSELSCLLPTPFPPSRVFEPSHSLSDMGAFSFCPQVMLGACRWDFYLRLCALPCPVHLTARSRPVQRSPQAPPGVDPAGPREPKAQQAASTHCLLRVWGWGYIKHQIRSKGVSSGAGPSSRVSRCRTSEHSASIAGPLCPGPGGRIGP